MSKNTVVVYVNGEAPKALKSNRTGKEFYLYSIFVKCSAPFPEKVSIFDDPKLPAGYYTVPFRFEVVDERLKVTFDWATAVKAQQS